MLKVMNTCALLHTENVAGGETENFQNVGEDEGVYHVLTWGARAHLRRWAFAPPLLPPKCNPASGSHRDQGCNTYFMEYEWN